MSLTPKELFDLSDDDDEATEQPNPFFKKVTEEAALSLSLKTVSTEFQLRTTRADLALEVPPDVSVQDTMFDFFRPLNVLEFKSEGDRLSVRKFIKTSFVPIWYSWPAAIAITLTFSM